MDQKPLSRLYVKMTVYFLCAIFMTFVSVSLIFYMTVGKPLAREIHGMLRSHPRYMGEMVTGLIEKNTPEADINHFIDQFSQNYGFSIAVIDRHGKRYFFSHELIGKTLPLTEKMFDAVAEKGIFVQSGHYGKPLIYLSPISPALHSDPPKYLFVTRTFSDTRADKAFLSGLIIIGFLLALSAYPLSKGITRPISDLSNSLKKMAAGNFDAMPVCERKDEIGELFRAYRNMSQSVNQMIHSKKQLLADISHELCSPLARIRVSTELLKEITTGDRSKRYLNNIERDIHSMDLLIGNLALFSRMNLPGFTLNRELILPEELVSHIYENYLPVVEQKNLRIDRVLDKKLPETLFDFERLKQVFTNLMDNAIRYSKEGSVIRIGVYEEGKWVVFFVEDQGPGVPEKEAERIFEPLYRVDSSRNREKGGAGLGLAIAKKIMEHHGGELVYKREQGQTVFSFRIESGRA